MKTLNLKQTVIAVIATIIIVGFATAAIVHIINLTTAGLINWKN